MSTNQKPPQPRPADNAGSNNGKPSVRGSGGFGIPRQTGGRGR